MNKSLPRYLLPAAFCLFSVLAWSAEKEPGGQGIIKSDSISSNRNDCFTSKIGKEIQLELCADYTINWKLWTLMGEPVGDYNLSWKLRSITLKNSSRSGIYESGTYYRPDTLPKELKKGVNAIQLYIDAVAPVSHGSDNLTGVFHSFDTGIPVRANAGSSYNTPGSPNWDKVFLRSDVCAFHPPVKPYLDAKAAKEEFTKGIQLNKLTLCPKSGLSELTALEAAIDKLCKKPGAHEEYRFCTAQKAKEKKEKSEDMASEQDGKDKKAKKKHESASDDNLLDGPSSGSGDASSIADLLDEDAERPQVQQRLAQLRAAYLIKAEAACQSTLRNIDACYAKTGCSRPEENPTAEQCKSIPAYPGSGQYVTPIVLTRRLNPGDVCYNEDAECRAVRAENKRKEAREKAEAAERIERQQSEWRASYGSLSDECKQREKERSSFASCQKQYGSTCNPAGFNTIDDCINEQARSNGPTEGEARAQLKQEWNAKARTAKGGKAGKQGNQTTTNFLD